MPPRVPAGERHLRQIGRRSRSSFASLALGSDVDCLRGVDEGRVDAVLTLLEVGREPVQSQVTSDMPEVVKTGTAVSLAPAM